MISWHISKCVTVLIFFSCFENLLLSCQRWQTLFYSLLSFYIDFKSLYLLSVILPAMLRCGCVNITSCVGLIFFFLFGKPSLRIEITIYFMVFLFTEPFMDIGLDFILWNMYDCVTIACYCLIECSGFIPWKIKCIDFNLYIFYSLLILTYYI